MVSTNEAQVEFGSREVLQSVFDDRLELFFCDFIINCIDCFIRLHVLFVHFSHQGFDKVR